MMRRLFLTAALAAVVALPVGTSSTEQVAYADPANAGLFGPFMLTLESLREGATAQQTAAIDAAVAAFEGSTAQAVSGELKLISKMLKGLDKAFAGNETYQNAADLLVVTYFAKVAQLSINAISASQSGGFRAVASVSTAVAAKQRALDLVKDGRPAELADYQKNRAKFRAKELALAKYCEGVIRKYGR